MSKEYIIENYEVTNLQDYVTPAKKILSTNKDF